MKGQKKKESEIEKLAIMVKEGFDKTSADISELKGDIAKLDAKIVSVETKVDNIETKLVGSHERRLERLEDRMIQVRTTLKMK